MPGQDICQNLLIYMGAKNMVMANPLRQTAKDFLKIFGIYEDSLSGL